MLCVQSNPFPLALLALAVLFLDVRFAVGQQSDVQRPKIVLSLLADLSYSDIRYVSDGRSEIPGVSALDNQGVPRMQYI